MDANVGEQRWLSAKQAAARIGVSVSLIRKAMRDGRLPARRVRGSRLLRIARADLDALLEPRLVRKEAESRTSPLD